MDTGSSLDEDNEFTNETFNITRSLKDLEFPWSRVCWISIFAFLIIVTVIGNTLIIIAVITTRRLRTVTNCFIMSLAVADWLVGTFVMPLAVASHLTGSWELGTVLCDIWVSSDVCLCTASILSLCVISIDRYFAITKPLNYTKKIRSKRLASGMIFVVWTIAICITCAPIFGWYDMERHKNKTCTYNQNKFYVVFSALGSFFLPLIVMLYVYVKISRVIARRHSTLHVLNQPVRKRKSKRRSREADDSDRSERHSFESEDHKSSRSFSRMGVSTPTCNAIQDANSMKVSFKREHKTVQTLSIVVGGFIACWLPFFCVYLANPFLPSGTIPPLLTVSLTWLGWLNSAINPFIYAFYSADFRRALWRITLGRCATRKQRETMQRSRTLRHSLYMKDMGSMTAPNRISINNHKKSFS